MGDIRINIRTPRSSTSTGYLHLHVHHASCLLLFEAAEERELVRLRRGLPLISIAQVSTSRGMAPSRPDATSAGQRKSTRLVRCWRRRAVGRREAVADLGVGRKKDDRAVTDSSAHGALKGLNV